MYYLESMQNTEKYSEAKYMIPVLRDNCFFLRLCALFII